MKNLGWLCAAAALLLGGDVRADSAADIIIISGVQGGVIVHVGCGDGQLTAALKVNDRFLVQGLDTSEQNVAAARINIKKAGSYGKVSADAFDGRSLPYVDNFVYHRKWKTKSVPAWAAYPKSAAQTEAQS